MMIEMQVEEFPGSSVVKTQCFPCHGPGFYSWRGTKNPQASWHGQKKNAGGHKPGVRLSYSHLTTVLLPTVLEIFFT